MSKYHAVSSGMVTRQALPSITRQRGTTTGSANLMLYGAGKTYAIGTNTTFTDSSANNFTVTRNGDTIQATANPFTGSVVFDGTSDYLSLANNAAFDFGTGDFTVECFVNFNSISYVNGGGGRGASVFSAASGFSGNGWNLEVGGNSSGVPNVINFNSRQGSSQVTVSASVTMANGPWYHIAVVRSGTLTSIYLNGVSVGSGTLSNQTISSVAALWVGGQDITNYQHWLNGGVSNARIVKGTAVYTANFTPPTSPLTAITNTSLLLLAGQQAPFRDSSANAFTVTANGNAAGSGVEPPSFVPYAGSGYFDGTGDSLTVPAGSAFAYGTGDFTVEGWFYSTAALPSFGAILFSQSVFGTNYFVVKLGDDNSVPANKIAFTATLSGGGTAILSSTTWTQNTWNHFAVCRVSGTVTVYLNGVGGTPTSNTTDLTNTTYVPTIGQYTHNTANPFTGYISNARVVKGTAVYTANFTPSAAPLTAITNTSLLLLTNNVGPFIDTSTNGFPVLRVNDTVQTGFNPFSQASAGAGYFDGTGDYLSSTTTTIGNFLTGDFTVEVFVNASSTATLNIMDFRGAGGTSGAFRVAFGTSLTGTANKIIAGWGSDDKLLVATNTANTNQWYHVAVTRSGTTARLFIDGVLNASATDSTSIPDSGLFVGSYKGTTAYYFGYMSNLRIVKGTAVYTANFTPPTSPLTAITNTSLLLLMDNYSIVNSTSTNRLVTLTGNTTTSTAQFPTGMNRSIYFDGSGDSLSVAASADFNFGTGDWTIEAYVYIAANSPLDGLNRRFALICETTNNGGFYINGDSTSTGTGLSIYNGTTGGGASVIGTISQNAWNHLAVSRAGSTAYFFANGTLVGTAQSISGNWGSSVQPLVVAQLGVGSFSFPLNGYISNLRICKGTALYTANFTPPSLPMPTTVTVPNFVTNNIYGMNQIP